MKNILSIKYKTYLYETLVEDNTIIRVTRTNLETNMSKDLPFDELAEDVQEAIAARIEKENEE